MKRFLLTLCFVLPILAGAQQNYQIKSTQGDVAIRQAGKSDWIKATALMYVDLDDVLSVKKGGSVTIVEKNTGRVFFSDKTGNISVEKRLVKTEENAQKLFYALNSWLKESMVKNKNGVHHAGAIGAVSRGCDTCSMSTDIYDSVYANILYFSSTAKPDNESDGIVVEETFGPGRTVALTLKNTSDKLLYCNVVKITDGQLSISYIFEDMDFIPLGPGEKVDLTTFPLTLDDGQYILVASEVDLYVDLLNFVFEGSPYVQPCNLSKIRLKAIGDR